MIICNLILRSFDGCFLKVLAGGRGKGTFKGGYKGGVKLVYSPEEVEESAKGMIGDFLITKQTGSDGRICNSVMITERKYTRKEYYIAFMNERAFNGPVIIASSEGGVNIEETAEKNPDAIVKFPIDAVEGLSAEGARKVAVELGIHESKVDEVSQILLNLYQLFVTKDASMVEINPFAEDNKGNFVCLDAKLKFDDNAEFRQKSGELKGLRSSEDLCIIRIHFQFLINVTGVKRTLEKLQQVNSSFKNLTRLVGSYTFSRV